MAEEVYGNVLAAWLLPLGVGEERWEGHIMWSVERVESKRDAKWLFLNENLDFLRLKCSNLHSQTKEQHLLVLFKAQNFQNISNYWSASLRAPRHLAMPFSLYFIMEEVLRSRGGISKKFIEEIDTENVDFVPKRKRSN